MADMVDPIDGEGSPHRAAKLAVVEAFSRSGLTKSALARRMGITESAMRRILDPDYPTKIGRLNETAQALGGRLDVYFIPGEDEYVDPE